MSSFDLRGGAQGKPGRFVELVLGVLTAAVRSPRIPSVRCRLAQIRRGGQEVEEPPGAFSLIVEASLLVLFVAVIDARLR